MVPVGQKGRITSGEKSGWSVFVEDDRSNTGGYLILMSPDDFTSSGFDDWVEAADLEEYFIETGWEITWLPIYQPY
ncbi:MAG: hypothetical protein V4671_02135 [Armatimonadota bacterium]